MLRLYKRFLCLTLAALVCCASLPALAATSWDAYVVSDTLTVYAKPSENAKVVMEISFGQKVTCTGTLDNWTRLVNEKGKAGYCLTAALSSKDPNTYSQTVYVQTASAPVYKRPSTSSRKLGTLKRDRAVTMLAVSADYDWVRVRNGDDIGYMKKISLDEVPFNQGQPAWITSSRDVGVLRWPNAGDAMMTLSFGQELYLVDTEDGWAKVRNSKGAVAFVPAGSVAAQSSSTLNESVYTQAGGKCLLKKFGNADSATEIARNTKLNVLTVDDRQQWALVDYKGQRRFIPYVYLGAAPRENGAKVLVTTGDDVMLTEQPRMGSKAVAMLPKGTPLYLLEGGPAGAKVQTVNPINGKQLTGWAVITMLTSY